MNAVKTGQFIREQRKKLGYSQQQLAQELFVEPQTVSKWERGLGMPDYDNVERLKLIFKCTLTDILEPSGDIEIEVEDEKPTELAEEQFSNYPVLWTNDGNIGGERRKKGFSLKNGLEFLNKKNINEMIGRVFGYEYENTYNEKFLFKNLLKKRTKQEFETSVSQGMFKDSAEHTVLGITAPWMWFRMLIVLAFCSTLAIICSVVSSNPVYGVIFCGASTVLPLLIFLFESDFSRSISIVQVFKFFTVGGLLSILFTLLLTPAAENENVAIVLLAPLFEEAFKAFVAFMFISKLKTKSILSGLLVGFAVGAGFDVFENFQYGITTYATELLVGVEEVVLGLLAGTTVDYAEALDGSIVASISVAIVRAICDIFSGHHYWTGIFGACFVLFNNKENVSLRDLFKWRVLLALLFSVTLHFLWNLSGVLGGIVGNIIETVDIALSVGAMIVLINIGIAQVKLNDIYQSAKKKYEDGGENNGDENGDENAPEFAHVAEDADDVIHNEEVTL